MNMYSEKRESKVQDSTYLIIVTGKKKLFHAISKLKY